ncbi:RUS family member 1 isoform X2 [Alligator mississippiensis]|uniref:RUS family member 1 isoform X2 n=1 Tax=Alligator mississippiensis TaxID=8496 RepID=UPI00287747F1|nr:RUS family member 1 isoform X2 [Alligator mississippiensis]
MAAAAELAPAPRRALVTEHRPARPPRPFLPGPDGRLRAPPGHAAAGPAASLRDLLTSVFLPQGFPGSVSPDYLPYQCWDTLQALASSVTGALATQAVLRGVGVGDRDASVAAATTTWILKDGTGMLGRIVFAWMKGSQLDCEAKQWRLFADILNDVAIFMEIVAPAFPACFTLILCTSGLFKCIVGVAGGATRAALTQHQARRDNMADVSAKDGSQETLVNLAGLLMSLILVPLVTGRLLLTYTLWGALTALHLYANYRAVRAVVMETLNRPRLRLALHHFLRHGHAPSPAYANACEPLLPGFGHHLRVTLGAPLRLLASSEAEFLDAQRAGGPDYLIAFDPRAGTVAVGLRWGAGPGVELRACTHALLLEAQQLPVPGAPHPEAAHVLHSLYPSFLAALEAAGWATQRPLLGAEDWRLDWAPPEKDL